MNHLLEAFVGPDAIKSRDSQAELYTLLSDGYNYIRGAPLLSQCFPASTGLISLLFYCVCWETSQSHTELDLLLMFFMFPLFISRALGWPLEELRLAGKSGA